MPDHFCLFSLCHLCLSFLCRFCLSFPCHLCLFTSCETTVSSEHLFLLVHGWQKSFQALAFFHQGFGLGLLLLLSFKLTFYFFGIPGPFTPFRGLGLLSLGFQPGLTDFRASAWVLGFGVFSSYEGNTTGN